MGWIDAKEKQPTDHKPKLVEVYNTFQNRSFCQVAWFDGAEWNVRGGRVVRWSEIPPDDSLSEIINRVMNAEPDIRCDSGNYIERSRIVRIIRGLE